MRSKDHQVICIGKDKKAPALPHSALIPLVALTARLGSIYIGMSPGQLRLGTVRTTN